MWRNDIKCKYMFMFSLKNLAPEGLIPHAIMDLFQKQISQQGIHQSLVDSSHNWPLTCRWDFMTPMWYHCNLITIWCSQQGIPILMRYFYIELSPNILIKDVNYTENTPYSLSIWYHSQEHGYLDIVFKDWYHSNASTCRSILHEEKLYGWIQKHHKFL